MRNNNHFVSKNSNSVFIILISLFIIVFVIVGYFMLSDNMSSHLSKTKTHPQEQYLLVFKIVVDKKETRKYLTLEKIDLLLKKLRLFVEHMTRN